MRILINIVEDDPDAWLSATQEDMDEAFARHRAFDAAIEERGKLLESAALSTTQDARVVRRRGDDWVVTEGPFAETAEQLTGFYVVELPDVDTALELCRLLPENYILEVRPTMALEGY